MKSDSMTKKKMHVSSKEAPLSSARKEGGKDIPEGCSRRILLEELEVDFLSPTVDNAKSGIDIKMASFPFRPAAALERS